MMERNEKMAEEIKRSHADALAALKAELEEERKARRIDGERLATESVFRVRYLLLNTRISPR